MTFKVLEEAGTISLNTGKQVVVQRVHVTGGQVDEVRLEGREQYEGKDGRWYGTKSALVFTSPEEAGDFAVMLAEAAEAWANQIADAAAPAKRERKPRPRKAAPKPRARTAASKRVAKK